MTKKNVHASLGFYLFFAIRYSSFVIRISSFSLSLLRHGRRLELGKAVAVDAYVADFMLFRNCARPQAEDSLP